MRKVLEHFPEKAKINAEAIFTPYKLFIYGDIHC
jgi:hypothetical protein